MGTITTRPITGRAAWRGSDLARSTDRALPPGFEVLWGSVEPGAPRGGIAQS